MQIPLKHSKTGWVEFPENEAKFKVAYPTVEQGEKLNAILMEVGLVDGRVNGDGTSDEDVVKSTTLKIKYLKLFLKYTIKDWQGIKDGDGNEVKCKVVNDELHTPYWAALLDGIMGESGVDINALSEHWVRINEEIKFTATDKKK